jgi:exopolyphosphatase/guanosine-5'-triphosphate,3'-diphosphate pyrophosphatase
MADLVALLDLGSNAARFLLVRITPGVGYRVLSKKRVQTRLGSGRAGELPFRAVDRTLSSISRFLAGATNGTTPRVLAVATAAVRDASNRDAFLEALRRREGVDVRLLDEQEEARLGAVAAMRSLPFRDGVIADLGGGSLGLTRVRAGRILSAASMPVGAVRMTSQFLRDDPPSPRQIRALRQHVREQVLGILPPARPGEELLALGGTVRALARLHLAVTPGGHARSRHGLRLHQADVTGIRKRLEALPLRKRRRVRGLKAERADIILAGAITIEELMVFGSYMSLTVSKGGVRDGILWRETFDRQV